MATVVPTPVPAGPPVPNSNDPELTFDAQFEASLTWQRNEHTPGMNLLAADTYANAVDAEENAVLAEAAKMEAQESAATALGSSNFRGAWSGLTGALATPASVSYGGRTWNLLENIADVTAELPGVSNKWAAYDIVMPVKNILVPGDPPSSIDSISLVSGVHGVINPNFICFAYLPASPAPGAYVILTVMNGRYDNVLMANGSTIEWSAENCVLDSPKTYSLRYLTDGVNYTWKFI